MLPLRPFSRICRSGDIIPLPTLGYKQPGVPRRNPMRRLRPQDVFGGDPNASRVFGTQIAELNELPTALIPAPSPAGRERGDFQDTREECIDPTSGARSFPGPNRAKAAARWRPFRETP